MTDPGRCIYHSTQAAILQWLIVPFPILAWLGGPARERRAPAAVSRMGLVLHSDEEMNEQANGQQVLT
jgi:hypothetical protein